MFLHAITIFLGSFLLVTIFNNLSEMGGGGKRADGAAFDAGATTGAALRSRDAGRLAVILLVEGYQTQKAGGHATAATGAAIDVNMRYGRTVMI